MKETSGNNFLLINEEAENDYYILPIINKSITNFIEAIAIWDSTIHIDTSLNLVIHKNVQTANECLYDIQSTVSSNCSFTTSK
jgi:hypothetical protein